MEAGGDQQGGRRRARWGGGIKSVLLNVKIAHVMRHTGPLRGHGAPGLAESLLPAGLGATGGQHPGQVEGDDQGAGGQ